MRWENLTLSEKEQVDFILPEDHRKGEFMIAAKFLTSRFLQMEAVARTFKQLWRTNKGFRIRNQGNNTVLFIFESLDEVDKILRSQLWSFDKHLIVMQRYSGEVPVQEIRFTKTPFWVQVHDISVSFLTRKVAEKLCETVGEIQINRSRGRRRWKLFPRKGGGRYYTSIMQGAGHHTTKWREN